MASGQLHLADGSSLEYDGLIIATGVTPRRLSAGHDLAGMHVLRTLDDALALRDGLASARRLVVVGGGLIGAEVAAVARKLGVAVTLVEPRRDLEHVTRIGMKSLATNRDRSGMHYVRT
jgi:NADPH-dependent 2,4-dienoyl-CoA reductase/sulfur reductase-like enzyme